MKMKLTPWMIETCWQIMEMPDGTEFACHDVMSGEQIWTLVPVNGKLKCYLDSKQYDSYGYDYYKEVDCGTYDAVEEFSKQWVFMDRTEDSFLNKETD